LHIILPFNLLAAEKKMKTRFGHIGKLSRAADRKYSFPVKSRRQLFF
jgi:hypothetical protein